MGIRLFQINRVILADYIMFPNRNRDHRILTQAEVAPHPALTHVGVLINISDFNISHHDANIQSLLSHHYHQKEQCADMVKEMAEPFHAISNFAKHKISEWKCNGFVSSSTPTSANVGNPCSEQYIVVSNDVNQHICCFTLMPPINRL